MKNTILYMVIALVLSSCGMSNNFNSQKFTSLKKIKPQKTEQLADESADVQTFYNEEESNQAPSETLNAYDQNHEHSAERENKLTSDDYLALDEGSIQPKREPITKSLEKNQPEILTNDKEFDQDDADQMAMASRILFWIGLGAAIVQLGGFIATLLIDASLALLGGWMPMMFVPLIAGAIAALCLFSAVIISFVYKSKANRRGLSYDRSTWKAILITGMTIGFIFLGNLFYTFFAFTEEFF